MCPTPLPLGGMPQPTEFLYPNVKLVGPMLVCQKASTVRAWRYAVDIDAAPPRFQTLPGAVSAARHTGWPSTKRSFFNNTRRSTNGVAASDLFEPKGVHTGNILRADTSDRGGRDHPLLCRPVESLL